MIKNIKGLVTKVITMANTKAVSSILIGSCLCVAALALLAVPMHTAGTQLALVQTYDGAKKK